MCSVQTAGRQVHCTSSIFSEIVEQSPLALHLDKLEPSGRPVVGCCLCSTLRVLVAAHVSSSGAEVGMVGLEHLVGACLSLLKLNRSCLIPLWVKSPQVEWSLKVLDLLHVSVGCSLRHFLAL